MHEATLRSGLCFCLTFDIAMRTPHDSAGAEAIDLLSVLIICAHMDQQADQTLDCKPTLGFAEVAPISKLIFSVTKQMRRIFEQQARLQDMTLPQWRALGQLVQSNGLSQAALATLIETDPMTTSKIL